MACQSFHIAEYVWDMSGIHNSKKLKSLESLFFPSQTPFSLSLLSLLLHVFSPPRLLLVTLNFHFILILHLVFIPLARPPPPFTSRPFDVIPPYKAMETPRDPGCRRHVPCVSVTDWEACESESSEENSDSNTTIPNMEKKNTRQQQSNAKPFEN